MGILDNLPFLSSLDIKNRACQHLGATRIASETEDSVNNAETSFVYTKLRRAELRRNTWRFATKHAVLRPIDNTTFLLSPALWNAGVQYLPGSVVRDVNGYLWLSNQANNIGNDPNETDVWDCYFGSMTVDAFDTSGSTAYFAGDLVYMGTNAPNTGGYVIYMSLQNGNTETPNVADAWNVATTYNQDETVSYSGRQWRSLIALNVGNAPVQDPANWSATQTYNNSTSDEVTGSDGYIYETQINGNVGINPVTDDGTNWAKIGTGPGIPNAWSAVPAMPASSSTWVPLYAALTSFNFVYPIGVGPLSQEMTKNIFRLPSGYLRVAPQDPKAGINSFLGAPAYNNQNDWLFEGNFLISQTAHPIIFRFIADVTKVTDMDDLFCEGLGARIGLETCETITNSNAKQQTCNNMYTKFMSEARIVDSIEVGPIEPPDDDYISCRL